MSGELRIEITETSGVVIMKAINPLLVRCREKCISCKKIKDGEKIFFEALANRFRLMLKLIRHVEKNNRVVYSQLSTNGTSWKGKEMLLKVD